ncbi:hypothetical protein [Streptomyces sp. TRM68416]|uniref:hypothetical protein n=1 Tax=Streptomyces sp. TRM68416 TaxID=2758412 RepID=UPI0016620004|nr:hypothetical protein [Streptomyces sp. TRM68416]MBD0844258.1 hypothetical protein [Streptomyces sp. TRM68416]
MGRTRGTWNTKGTWAAGIALAALLALTGVAVLGGGDEDTDAPGKGGSSASASASPGPSATYAPPEQWTEPDSWAALPRGKRTDDHGSPVGFPKSTEGAVAMMAAANTVRIGPERDAVDEQVRLYRSYVAEADQSDEAAETVELRAVQTDKQLHKSLGVPVGEPLPAGAYMRATVVGYKVIAESGDRVSVWLLTRTVQKGGETVKESGSYTRTLSGAAWTGGDWKLSGPAVAEGQQKAGEEPEMAAPGDEAFNRAGWTAIREAS